MIAAGKGTMDQGFGQRFGYTAFPIYIIRSPPKYAQRCSCGHAGTPECYSW